jgi:hypothetical protein
VQIPLTKTSVLGRSILVPMFNSFVKVLFVETAVGMSDVVEKLYKFVSVLRKLKIFCLTEDHIL